MFKFEKNPIFKWPVKVQVPVDGGTFEEHVFTARWQVQDSDDLRKAQFAPGADPVKVLFERALKGWEADFVDMAGAPIPFAPEMVDEARRVPHVKTALVQSYWDACDGGLRAKN